MDEWQEWRRKQEELEQEQKRKREETEKRARILREVHRPTCEQIQTAPYTPPGPPEATIGKQLEAIELKLGLFKTQLIGIAQVMLSLGYDVSPLWNGLKK